MIPRLLLVCSACAALSGAELVIRDLRLGAGVLPTAFDWSLASRSGSSSGSDSFDAGLSIGGGARWSFARAGDPLGIVVGADLELDGWTYSRGSLATTAGRAGVGPGWALSDDLSLIATAGALYGISTYDGDASQAAPSFSATGSMTGYDLRLEASYLITRRFGLSMQAGWLIATQDLSGDEGIALTIDQSGWFAGLQACWRFADTPTRLE